MLYQWSQIEKECYAILFACKKLHCYFYGQEITVISDHELLIPIFKKSLINVNPRLTRLLLALQNYCIHVAWTLENELKLAYFSSRAYLEKTVECTDDVENVNFEVYAFIKQLPISKEWYKLFKGAGGSEVDFHFLSVSDRGE